jgi:hypothetical protein
MANSESGSEQSLELVRVLNSVSKESLQKVGNSINPDAVSLRMRDPLLQVNLTEGLLTAGKYIYLAFETGSVLALGTLATYFTSDPNYLYMGLVFGGPPLAIANARDSLEKFSKLS